MRAVYRHTKQPLGLLVAPNTPASKLRKQDCTVRQNSISVIWNCLRFKGIKTHHAPKKQSLFHQKTVLLLTPGKSEDSWGTDTCYQGLTTNVTATWKSPSGKYMAFESFPLSFQDTNYKIPEQWGSWSRYKVRAKGGERLKAYSQRNRIAITSLVLWVLTLKEHLQPKNRQSYLHKEWDVDTRQENSASEYLRKNQSLYRSHLLLDSRQNWMKSELLTNSSTTTTLISGILYRSTSLEQH